MESSQIHPRRSRIFLSLTIGILFFCAVTTVTAFFILRTRYIAAAIEVCDLIDSNYFRSAEPAVQDFLKTCREDARTQSFLFSKAANIARINERLAKMQTSHLNVYRPEENTALWESRAVETGIRARFVESDLIVYRVLPGSVAEAAGIKPGDILISVNEREISSSQSVQSLEGRYSFERAGHLHTVELVPTELSEDLSPKLEELTPKSAVLRIGSFLPQYFSGSENAETASGSENTETASRSENAGAWNQIADRLEKYDYLIIDLRDNSGGSFPAMLRALSPFRCHDHQIGKLMGPANAGERVESEVLKDTLDAESQLQQLHEARNVELETFGSYGCYHGPVTVLIDSGTSSTAEIFAESFYVRQNSRVWGQPSAGQVVMAQWFQILNFGGDDTSMSIPIAGYLSALENPIEGEGLIPEKALVYDPVLARKGVDSWIVAARDFSSKTRPGLHASHSVSK